MVNKYLNESLKIDKTILKAITSSGYKINKSDYDYDIQLGDSEKTLSLNGVNQRAGRVIRKLLPDLNDKELNEILGKIKASRASKKKEFEIFLSNNVTEIYTKAYNEGGVCSCMVEKKSLTKFYDNHDNIQIAYLKNKHGIIIARALVWYNCIDQTGKVHTFMDRVYPYTEKLITIMHDYAEENGWLYRPSNSADSTTISNDKQLFFDVNFNTPVTIPWMDTLIMAYPLEGFITNQPAHDAEGTYHNLQSTMGVYIEPPEWTIKKLINTMKTYERVNDDGVIEIRKNVDLSKTNLTKIPEYFKDKIIRGHFIVSRNHLKSLKNSPIEVKGNYDVFFNKKLKSLKDCTQNVHGHFRAYGCDLRSLEGAPEEIGKSFNVSKNQKLSSLEGGPERVGYRYWAHHCNLKSLDGIARYIKKPKQSRFDENPGNFTKKDILNAINNTFNKKNDIDFYSDEAVDDLDESTNILDVYGDILNG